MNNGGKGSATNGGGGAGTARSGAGRSPAKPGLGAEIAKLTAVPRSASTREFLTMDWNYPVYTPPQAERTNGTSAVAARHALSREEAIRFIAGSDPRPLLVLRECPVCNKTDDALLKGGADNERTLILARWFHCVKLPVDVVEDDHPFNALFPDNESEHLFLALADGSERVPLESEGSRTELWTGMSRILASAYEKDPSGSFGDIVKRFDKLDELEAKLLDLEVRRSAETEATRPDRQKVEQLDQEMQDVKSRIGAEKATIERMRTVPLKRKPAPEPAPAAK